MRAVGKNDMSLGGKTPRAVNQATIQKIVRRILQVTSPEEEHRAHYLDTHRFLRWKYPAVWSAVA